MPEMLNLKKVFSQNFIQSSEVINDILDALGADEDSFVMEIGPGAGALTVPLAEKAGHLAAVEIDRRLVKMLREKFKDNDKVRIVFDDILQVDFKDILEHEHAERFKKLKIVGNIPYNITSPIIYEVLESGIAFENFTLMIQKEVADRVCSPPGKRVYGLLSVFVQYHTEPSYIRTVGRELFLPTPTVDSAVVNLKFRSKPPVDCDKEKFFALVKQSFSHKRKTLANNLAGYIAPDKKQAAVFLEGIGIDPKRRAETLSLEEFALIADACSEPAAAQTSRAVSDEDLSKW